MSDLPKGERTMGCCMPWQLSRYLKTRRHDQVGEWQIIMAFMDAYGRCQNCGGEGALWETKIECRKFIFFGPIVKRTRYYCDECEHLGGGYAKD